MAKIKTGGINPDFAVDGINTGVLTNESYYSPKKMAKSKTLKESRRSATRVVIPQKWVSLRQFKKAIDMAYDYGNSNFEKSWSLGQVQDYYMKPKKK